MRKKQLRLFHGTTAKNWLIIKEKGLLPEKSHGNTNCRTDDDLRANPEFVYLTTCQAPFYSGRACDPEQPFGSENWAIIEIDTQDIDLNLLHPDEDYMWARYWKDPQFATQPKQEILQYFRERLYDYQSDWINSIHHHGVCAHLGPIPPEKILRVSLFDPRTNPFIAWMAVDPIVNASSLTELRDDLEALTYWFFHEKISTTDLEKLLACMNSQEFENESAKDTRERLQLFASGSPQADAAIALETCVLVRP